MYKGLLVVFGLFLAYESRNVKYFYINDSRFVTIAMYIVVILVGIGATISLVLAQNWFGNPAYGLAVAMVVVACLSCLLILFVPKVSSLVSGGPVRMRVTCTYMYNDVCVSCGCVCITTVCTLRVHARTMMCITTVCTLRVHVHVRITLYLHPFSELINAISRLSTTDRVCSWA